MASIFTGTQEAPAYGTQYRGPCPGEEHTYSFRLYALSEASVDFRYEDPISQSQLDEAFGAVTLDMAILTGTFDPAQ